MYLMLLYFAAPRRFVKGCRPGHQTGFDIDVADLSELEQVHKVIVASAIFGNVGSKAFFVLIFYLCDWQSP